MPNSLAIEPTPQMVPVEGVNAATDAASQAVDPTADPARKPALPALSGLRTLLALNVMFFHFVPPHPVVLSPLLENAYVFVGFFFLISGFVLAYNYADRPQLSKRAFYLARFSRIYPVYLLVLLLSAPFLVEEWKAHTPGAFALGLVLTPLALQGWSPALATFWNTVGWTLSAELMLYLLFPYLIGLLRRRAAWLQTPRQIILAIACMWVLGILPHTTYLLTNPDHLSEPATRYTYGLWLRALKYSPPAYLCTFLAGILLARLHAAVPLTPVRRGVLALVALVGLGLFFAFAVGRVPYVIVHGSLLLPLFGALVLGLAGPNWASAVFAVRPLVLLGEATFALYLLHFNAWLLLHFYQVPERLGVARFDPWISYAAILAGAVLVLHGFERPARGWVMRRLAPSATST